MHEEAFLSNAGDSAWAPIVLLDISTHGASFATAEAVANGEVRRLRFSLPGSRTLHHVSFKVVHCGTAGVPSGYRVGARFVAIDAGTTDQIVNFVSKTAKA
jgi:hypothetical protein